ncbi:hypothetical protein Dimus_005872 [Dionaea muscipula]
MSVIHLKKKDVVKSKVRGVEIEFDHEKLATILGIPGNNGICEYVKDVWEESKYIKPLEITRRFANDETLTAEKKGESSSDDQFYDAQVEIEEPSDETPRQTAVLAPSSTRQKDKEPSESTLVPHSAEFRKSNSLKFQSSLKERGQTDFMMIWRRPKSRMPDF